MNAPTNRDSDRFMLRLPDGMRERIKRAASANSRSMNAEIIATLEEKYPPSAHQHALQKVIISLMKTPSELRPALMESFAQVVEDTRDEVYVSRFVAAMEAARDLAEAVEEQNGGPVTDGQIEEFLGDLQVIWDGGSRSSEDDD